MLTPHLHTLHSIIGSSIFKFIVGPHNREYNVHGAAISKFSKPLHVLLNGHMREAQEKCVNWPDVDEKTFVRFVQWAYTNDYVTEEPDIVLDQYSIEIPASSQGSPEPEMTPTDRNKVPEKTLYSLIPRASPEMIKEHCWNRSCLMYGNVNETFVSYNQSATCAICKEKYGTNTCSYCDSVFFDCPQCGPPTAVPRSCCKQKLCHNYNIGIYVTTTRQTCLRCQAPYSTRACSACCSVYSDCPPCAATMSSLTGSQRGSLIYDFLDESGTKYPTSTSVFLPRKNTEACEDYAGVFLCHAKLYVLGDKYDIPPLRQLTLHRLHATLKEFTLYPSRMNDIATLAKYVFENTVPEDKIRDMITLYYACIVEDATKYDGLKSLIDEIPDFAFGLISKMTERLS